MAKPITDGARWSKSAVGTPQVASNFNKFDMHKIAQFPIGFKVEDAKGNVYRYAHFSADTNRGVLVSPDLSETSVVDSDNVITAPASAQTTTDGTIGNKYVEITLASIEADDFAGGSLVITDDTGEGYTYDIVGNTATGVPAASVIRLQLAQPLQVALDATSDFAISPSKYSNLEIATATDTAPIGVSCSTMDVSEAPFGWIQTRGDVGILQDGVIAIGNPVQLSDGTSGAVQVFGGATVSTVAAGDLVVEPILGYCLIAGDSGGAGVFRIMCE